MSNKFKKYFILAGAGLWPWPLLASDFGNLLNAAANKTYDTKTVDENALEVTLGKLIFTLLSFLGVIFTALIIYGGILWMTARGNEEEVTKAKRIIREAAIGLVITLSAYALWVTIQNLLFYGTA